MLIVIGILLGLYLLIRFSGLGARQKLQKEKELFWQKEHEANLTRKVDITNLDYITIPLENLPFMDTEDATLNAIQKTIKTLSDKQILNLTGLSNTDLKLQYGAANIAFLSQCDGNYTLLVQNIYKWGAYLVNLNKVEEAITVLEFGITCKTDVSKNYILLAKLYKDNNNPDQIDELIQVANDLKSLTKDSILSSLKEIKLSYYLV